jgi:hypothetical protein
VSAMRSSRNACAAGSQRSASAIGRAEPDVRGSGPCPCRPAPPVLQAQKREARTGQWGTAGPRMRWLGSQPR